MYLKGRLQRFITKRRAQRRWNRQRIKRGFSDLDWWNLDSFIAQVIADAVRKQREEGHGHPLGLSYREWVRILVKIEDGFRSHLAMKELVHSTPDEVAELRRKFKDGGELFIHWFEDLWD